MAGMAGSDGRGGSCSRLQAFATNMKASSQASTRRRRHLPWFTGLTLVALLLSATVTGSLAEPLTRVFVQALGIAARDVAAGDWQRLIVSALVTHGGWVLARALVWVALAVGAMEIRFGTVATALTFWSAHFVAVLSIAAGLTLGAATSSAASTVPERLAAARDVGPSAGYLACFACILWSLSGRKRALGIWAVVAVLVVLPFVPPLAPVGPLIDLTADIAHLLAFGYGSLIAWILLATRGSTQRGAGSSSRAT